MAPYGEINTRTLAALAMPVLPVAPPLMMGLMETSTAPMGDQLEDMAHFAPALCVTLDTVVHTVR